METREEVRSIYTSYHSHIYMHPNLISGRASYLSANICEEFISLIAKQVKEKIISEIVQAKYDSINVDSTPVNRPIDRHIANSVLSFCELQHIRLIIHSVEISCDYSNRTVVHLPKKSSISDNI